MTERHGIISHTADLGLWVEADGREELYKAAVGALGEIMISGSRDGEVEWITLSLTAEDPTDLMVRLLSEMVYLLDAQQLVTVALSVDRVTDTSLEGRLGVVTFDPHRHEAGEPVKAVTYHGASVGWEDGRWKGRVVLDV